MEQVYAISLILLFVTAVSSTPTNVTSNLLVTIQTGDNFNLTYGGADLVFPDVTPKNFGVKTYSFGKRTPWDRILASGSQSYSSPFPKNFQAVIHYPVGALYGDKVTAVEINVRQSNSGGAAFITDGGIGHKKITILVQAVNTLQFEYTAIIYSSASRLQSFGLLVSLVSLLLFSSSSFKLL